MAVTRINNNQISDASSGNAAAGINATTKLQDYTVTAGKLANNITYGSNFTITGNLEVQGNTTQINTDIVTVEDPLLILASNQAGAPALDIGFIGQRGTAENIAFVWEESANAFVTAFTTTAESNTTITVTSYADFKTNNANVTGTLAVVGTTSLVGNIISDANVTGNLNSANVFTPGAVSATGLVTGGNISTVGNVNSGNINVTGFVGAGNVSVSGNVTTANINVGPVTILDTGAISGVTTIQANANISTTGNVVANGVYANAYYTANGTPLSTQAAGSNTQVQYNAGGNNEFGASSAFTFDYAAGANLLTAGNITSTGTLSAVGTATVGNVATAGNVSATGLVTGGNIETAGTVSATGTVTGGNLITAGIANASAVTVTTLSNTQVVFANAVGGLTNDAAFTYNYAAGAELLTVGNVSATGTVKAADATVTSLSNTSVVYANATSGLTQDATFTFTTANSTLQVGNVSATGTTTSGYEVVQNLSNTQIVFANTTSGLVGNSTLTFDSATGNLNAPIVYASGNVTGNALNAIGDLKVGGIGNIGNLVVPGTANVVGNIDGSNINLSGIANVVGNLNAGNVSTANVAAGNVNGTIIYTANVTSANTITLTSAGAITLAAAAGASNVSLSGSVLNQVGTPAAPTDGANKEYVDSVASGLDLKASCELGTTTALDAIAGVTNVVYNNGASGVGATLTITSGSNVVIDGTNISTLAPNTRILIKNESLAPTATSDAAWNGIYVLNTAGPTGALLTRSTDTDDEGTTGQLPGAFTFISTGVINADTGYVCSTNNPIVMGTTPIIWTQFSAAGVYTAGAGLELIGTQFSAQVDNVTTSINGSGTNGQVVVKTSALFTTPQLGAATFDSFTANLNTGNGNISANNVSLGNILSAAGTVTGNLALFTAGQVSANTATVTSLGNIGVIYSNATGGLQTDAVDFNYNPVTKTLSAINVGSTGNVEAANVRVTTLGNIGVVYANATGGLTSDNANFSYDYAVGNLTAPNVTATLTVAAANARVTSLGNTQVVFANATGGLVGASTLTFDVATGNLGATNVTATATVAATDGTFSSLGNTEIVYANATGGLQGTTDFVFNPTGSGNVTVTGNVAAGNVTTGGLVSATGNVTGANVFTGGNVSATGDVTGANVLTGGNVSATGNVTGNNINVGPVTLTSTAALTGLVSVTANGNITTTGNVSANAMYSDNYFYANGTPIATESAGSNTQVQIANASNGFIATSAFTFDYAAGANLLTAGNITSSGALSAVGNVTANNAGFTNGVTANTATITTTATIGNLTLVGPAIESNAGIIAINGAAADNDFAVNGTGANVLYVDAGTNTVSIGSSAQTTNAILALNSTNSFVVPVGNTLQRPATGVVGMQRFNTTLGKLEIFDGLIWAPAGSTNFTVVADNQFMGDGTTTAFTLSSEQTTNSCIVSINGVVQVPGTAYSVTGTTLTFTEAPAVADEIDVRQITTTTTVISVSNSSGNAVVGVSETSANVLVTGNLVVQSGGFLYGDGTYLTNVGGGNVTATKIVSGTTQANIAGAGGQFYVEVAGANVMNVQTGNVAITGDLVPSANATYDLGSPTNQWNALYVKGNTIYIGDGTIQSNASGVTLTNANGGSFTVGGDQAGAGNIAGGNVIVTGVVSTTGTVKGLLLSSTGNVTAAGNVNAVSINASGIVTGASVSASGTVTAGQFSGNGNSISNIQGSAVSGAVTSATSATTAGTVTTGAQANITSVGTLTSLTVSGLVDGGVFQGAGNNLSNIQGANVNGTVASATGATTAGTVTTAAQGNITSVGTLTSLSVSGATTTGSLATAGTVSATGNITGGNITTAGTLTAGTLSANNVAGSLTTATQANITTVGTLTSLSVSGATTSSSTISATGNITGGNVITSGVFHNGNITISGSTITSVGATLTIDPNGSGGTDGNVVITGNLTVQGTTTTVNSNNVSINDLVFNVANNASSSSLANGGGLGVGPVGSEYATLTFNNGTTAWNTSVPLSVTGTVSATNLTGSLTTAAQANITSVGNLTSLSVVGNTVTGNLSTAGNVTANNVSGTLTTGIQAGITQTGILTSLSVTGAITTGAGAGSSMVMDATAAGGRISTGAGDTIQFFTGGIGATLLGGFTTSAGDFSAVGNITSGNTVTASRLALGTGTATVGNIVNGNGNTVGNIGSSSNYFNTVFAQSTSALYADLAEKYVADAEYAPGTVVAFGGEAEVTASTANADRRVAGVVSTNPSYIMNGGLAGDNVVTVALTGRVPCRVTGTVRKGDLMVSNGDGTARAEENPAVGSVLGKALENHDGATGTIEVVVGRV